MEILVLFVLHEVSGNIQELYSLCPLEQTACEVRKPY